VDPPTLPPGQVALTAMKKILLVAVLFGLTAFAVRKLRVG
jgi:hypothetical protein